MVAKGLNFVVTLVLVNNIIQSVSAKNGACASNLNAVEPLDACPTGRSSRFTDIASVVIDTGSPSNDTTECLCLVTPMNSGAGTQVQLSFAIGSPTENRTLTLPNGNALSKGASSLIFGNPPWLLNYTSIDGTTLLPSCFQLEATSGRFRIECARSVDLLHSSNHRNDTTIVNNRDETTPTTTMHAYEQNTTATTSTTAEVNRSSKDKNTDVIALAVCVTVIPVAIGIAVVVLLTRRRKIMKSKAVAVNTGADNFDLREINDEKLETMNKKISID